MRCRGFRELSYRIAMEGPEYIDDKNPMPHSHLGLLTVYLVSKVCEFRGFNTDCVF